METFIELGLSEELLKGIADLGFETPTDIQIQAIPHLMGSSKDFIGLAQTGTGKTAAFGLPLLERIDPDTQYTQALVLAPTRELGQQIADQLYKYSKYQKKLNVLAVYGGASISTQIRALRNTQHVIIATPGRLIDLVKRKAVKLDQLDFLVLDEADEMLNMGFKEELDTILSYTPEEKVTWLFSATMPNEIKRIVKKYMDDPFEVKVNAKDKVNTNIEHQFVVVRQADKKDALLRFLDLDANMRGLVFCRTKRETQALAEDLLKKNYQADALHGDLSQAQRDRVMKRFRDHHLQVCIATDVAARGIDVNDLTHVFHFTLPDDDAYYTHRSGRTARAGKQGISISFINGREKYKITRIERNLRISFKQILIPNVSDIAAIRVEKWCHQILETQPKGKIGKELIERVHLLFGNLSKEELTAKFLMNQLESLNLDASKELNDPFKRDHHSGERKSYDRDRRGGGRDGRRGGGRRESTHRKGSNSRRFNKDKEDTGRKYKKEENESAGKKFKRKSDASPATRGFKKAMEEKPARRFKKAGDDKPPRRFKKVDDGKSDKKFKKSEEEKVAKKFKKKTADSKVKRKKSPTKTTSSFTKKIRKPRTKKAGFKRKTK